jgi:glycerol-3-phosphate dehydrogenase
VFAEQVLALDAPGRKNIFLLSQGAHFVIPQQFLPGVDAMMVPRTADGRVLFAIPWHGHVLVGTTDVPVSRSAVDPRASDAETDFLCAHIKRYLGRRPQASEVLSVWAGLRPLLKTGRMSTAKLSRDHKVLVSGTGLVTVTGGKWTTYRRMGEDAVNRAAAVAGLASAPSRTATLKLHGWMEPASHAAMEETDSMYGSDLVNVRVLGDAKPQLNEKLHEQLPYRRRDVVWAVLRENARTVEDVLARRTRALFLNARAAIEAAPEVSHIIARGLQRSEEFRSRDLQSFLNVAAGYVYRD